MKILIIRWPSAQRPRWLTFLLEVAALVAVVALTGCTAASEGESNPGREHTTARNTSSLRMAGPGANKVEKEGTNPAPWVIFRDRAADLGLTYTWPQKPRPMRNLEAFGTGCAFLDYNGDGLLDILLVGEPSPVLYRNQGNSFTDVSESTGLASQTGQWKGVAVGDYDGDGWLDILLAGYRCLALLRNRGGEGFENVTEQVGLDPENRRHWGSGCGFMDLDNDGDLEIVLLNYVVFGPSEPQYCDLGGGRKSGCPPQVYRPEFPELWKYENGRYIEWTEESGLRAAHGKALVLAFADLDNNGLIDFYIGNDGEPAELWMNRGNLVFEDMGAITGVAYGMTGKTMAAMCADWGDFDRDGLLDLVVSDFSGAPYAVFRNTGVGLLFHEYSAIVGVRNATMNALGFGGKFVDFDNDSWQDIAFANGHVYDNVEEFDSTTTFRQPVMLFYNQRGKRFTDLVPFLPPEVGRPILGRGLATGDIDNDGRMELLVVDYEGPVMLLHNQSRTDNNWIKLDVRGNPPNVFAYGAKVTLRTASTTCVAFVSPASSYLSSSDRRIHFGLGKEKIESVSVEWRSGTYHEFRNLEPNRIYVLQEDGSYQVLK